MPDRFRMLRLRHCPQRFGFGMRYLNDDLPADVAQRLTALAFVADASELPAKTAECMAWLRDVLRELYALDLTRHLDEGIAREG